MDDAIAPAVTPDVPQPRPPADDRPPPDPRPLDRTDLLRAVRGEGVELVAQPIVAVESGTIAGYELLTRFRVGPAAPPNVWFATARREGLAGALTRTVFAAMHELRPSLPENVFCTVNVEPDLLLDDAVHDALHATGDLSCVVVELTEHVAIGDGLAPLKERLEAIRAAGGTVAIDDAGTGYAGLSQLLELRPDLIKLDHALVSGLDTDPVRRALVELIGSLSGRMDAWLLAEGVETADEFAVLARLGVPLAQGWYLGRPATPWAALDPGVHREVCMLARRASLGRHVAALVRRRPTREIIDGSDETGDVIVDDAGRPIAVVVAQVHGSARVPAMCVAPSSDPADVLRRAMARPDAHRCAPVVCTDPRGQVLGTIDVADLVEAALTPEGES